MCSKCVFCLFNWKVKEGTYSRTCDAGGQLLPRELKSFDVARQGSLVWSYIPLSLSHFSFSSIHLFVLFPFSRVYVSYSFLIYPVLFFFSFPKPDVRVSLRAHRLISGYILKLKVGRTSCGLKTWNVLASVRFELATSLRSLSIVFSYSLDQTRLRYSYRILLGNVRWPAK